MKYDECDNQQMSRKILFHEKKCIFDANLILSELFRFVSVKVALLYFLPGRVVKACTLGAGVRRFKSHQGFVLI